MSRHSELLPLGTLSAEASHTSLWVRDVSLPGHGELITASAEAPVRTDLLVTLLFSVLALGKKNL